MRNLIFALLLLFFSGAYAADCVTTECACMLVTYHDPAAPVGQDIVTDKFSWQEAPEMLNRRLGKWNALTIQLSTLDTGIQTCCIVIDNQGTSQPFSGIVLNYFGSSGPDRREIHILLYWQIAEEALPIELLEADWQVITDGDMTNPVASPPLLAVDGGQIRSLLNGSDSRTIPLSEDQALIDEAVLLRSANRLDLLNGC